MLGYVSIGRAPPAAAPLMLVSFAKSEAAGEPPLELLVAGRGLSLLGENELGELLDRARPYSGARKQGLFSEIRTGKKADQ